MVSPAWLTPNAVVTGARQQAFLPEIVPMSRFIAVECRKHESRSRRGAPAMTKAETRNWKMEIRNWKFEIRLNTETRKWKFETRHQTPKLESQQRGKVSRRMPHSTYRLRALQ